MNDVVPKKSGLGVNVTCWPSVVAVPACVAPAEVTVRPLTERIDVVAEHGDGDGLALVRRRRVALGLGRRCGRWRDRQRHGGRRRLAGGVGDGVLERVGARRCPSIAAVA